MASPECISFFIYIWNRYTVITVVKIPPRNITIYTNFYSSPINNNLENIHLSSENNTISSYFLFDKQQPGSVTDNSDIFLTDDAFYDSACDQPTIIDTHYNKSKNQTKTAKRKISLSIRQNSTIHLITFARKKPAFSKFIIRRYAQDWTRFFFSLATTVLF